MRRALYRCLLNMHPTAFRREFACWTTHPGAQASGARAPLLCTARGHQHENRPVTLHLVEPAQRWIDLDDDFHHARQ